MPVWNTLDQYRMNKSNVCMDGIKYTKLSIHISIVQVYFGDVLRE